MRKASWAASLLLCWLWCCAALAAPAFVQGAVGADNQSGTSITVTLTNTVGSGNAVMGCFSGANNGTPTVTVTDDKSNSYTTLDYFTGLDGGIAIGTAFFATNLTNSPKTVTVTPSSSVTFARVMADEFSGVAASGALDVHTGQEQLGAPTGTDGITSGTTAGSATAGDLIYGCMMSTSNLPTAPSSGTGFTTNENCGSSPVNQCASEFKVLGSSGTVAATFTDATSANDVTWVIALKPPSAAAAPGGGHLLPLLGVGK